MRALGPALLCALALATAVFAESTITQSGGPAAAETFDGNPENEIKVCIDLDAIVRFDILITAQRTLRDLYRGIGVNLRFGCDHSPEESIGPLRIRISDRIDRSMSKSALGFSRPYARDGVRITVFYDRVLTVQNDSSVTGIILGHVMAHELGHVLAAEDGHADTGIMRNRWSESDFQAMRVRQLYFSESDVRAIHGHLSAFLQP